MKRYLFLLLPLAVLLLCFPRDAAAAVTDTLRVCGTSLIPALFPYMILCKLIVGLQLLPTGGKTLQRIMHRFFGVSDAVFPALLVSFIGGYPVGAATVCDLYRSGTLSKADAERALRFCNNSGPAFFLGVIGSGLFSDISAGLLLYLIHILAAVLTGRIFASSTPRIRPVKPKSVQAPSFGAVFLQAVADTCTALLKVCALVIAFRVMLALCNAAGFLHFLPQEAVMLFSGTMELTCGILSLCAGKHAFVFAALFMGWGGLCVHMQTQSLMFPLGLEPRGYYAAKVLHALLSALFALTVMYPTPIWIVSSSICVIFSCLIPQIRKKYSGNLRRIAV